MVRLVIKGILFFTAVGLFVEAVILEMHRQLREDDVRRATTAISSFSFPEVSRRNPAQATIEIPSGREWKGFQERWNVPGIILAWVGSTPDPSTGGVTISGPDGPLELEGGSIFPYLHPTTQRNAEVQGWRLPTQPETQVAIRVSPTWEDQRPGTLMVLSGVTSEEVKFMKLDFGVQRWLEGLTLIVAAAFLFGALVYGRARRATQTTPTL